MRAADKPDPGRKGLKKYQDFRQHSVLLQPETADLPPWQRGLSRQVNRKAGNNRSLQYDCSLQANSETLPCQIPNALFRFPRGRSKTRRNGRGHIRGGPEYGFFLKKSSIIPVGYRCAGYSGRIVHKTVLLYPGEVRCPATQRKVGCSTSFT